MDWRSLPRRRPDPPKPSHDTPPNRITSHPLTSPRPETDWYPQGPAPDRGQGHNSSPPAPTRPAGKRAPASTSNTSPRSRRTWKEQGPGLACYEPAAPGPRFCRLPENPARRRAQQGPRHSRAPTSLGPRHRAQPKLRRCKLHDQAPTHRMAAPDEGPGVHRTQARGRIHSSSATPGRSEVGRNSQF